MPPLSLGEAMRIARESRRGDLRRRALTIATRGRSEVVIGSDGPTELPHAWVERTARISATTPARVEIARL